MRNIYLVSCFVAIVFGVCGADVFAKHQEANSLDIPVIKGKYFIKDMAADYGIQCEKRNQSVSCTTKKKDLVHLSKLSGMLESYKKDLASLQAISKKSRGDERSIKSLKSNIGTLSIIVSDLTHLQEHLDAGTKKEKRSGSAMDGPMQWWDNLMDMFK